MKFACMVIFAGLFLVSFASTIIKVGRLIPTHETINIHALKSSIHVINATLGVDLEINKIIVRSGSLLEHSTRCNGVSKRLSEVAYIFEPYQVDPMSCVISEILKVPHVTLSHEHHSQCSNVISLRPDPRQLNQALIAMIKEHQPREVAVIIEEGLGETASDIMSHDHLVNKLFFQIIGTVDFAVPSTISAAIDELKSSGITKILLAIQGDNVEKLMKEVKEQGLISPELSWYIPFAEFDKFKDKSALNGVYGLELPIDVQELNETLCELKELMTSHVFHDKSIEPLLHDSLQVMANTDEEFKIRCSQANRQKDTRKCKVNRKGDKCGSTVDFIKRVLVQRGITGDVKFTLSGYRNITRLNVKQITNGKEYLLGSWSTACDTFIWNPGTTYAEQKLKGRCTEDKEEEDGQLIAFKPRKRRLKVVTYIEEPFMMMHNDSTLNGNDRFYGFLKELLDRLQKDLDFEYVIHEVADRTYGVQQEDGSWNGMLGELITKKADIAAAAMTITSSRQQVVEFTKPYMDFTMALIMEKPKGKSLDLFAFLRPFHPSVWVSLIAVTFVTAVLIYIIDRHSRQGYKALAKQNMENIKGDEFKIHNSIWFVSSTLLQQGAELTPMSGPGRVLGTAFWFYALILISTYTANLAAFFATNKIESNINSLEDLANQDEMRYGVLKSGTTYDFFKEATIPLYRKMFNTMTAKHSFASSSTSGVQQARDGGYAYLTDGPVLKYKHQRRPCNTFLLKNLLMAKGYGLGLQLNSEWTQLLSVRILKLKEEGFIESLRLKYWDERSQCLPDGAKRAQPLPSSLDVYNVAGVFIVLCAGTGVAFLFLFLEKKATSWMRGRCFGCCAKEEIFHQNSKNGKTPAQPMLTYIDYQDNGPGYSNPVTKMRKDVVTDSPKSIHSYRFNDLPPSLRQGKNVQAFNHIQDRESTL